MNLDASRDILIQYTRSAKNGLFPEVVRFAAALANPLCGDHVELRVHSEGHRIEAHAEKIKGEWDCENC